MSYRKWFGFGADEEQELKRLKNSQSQRRNSSFKALFLGEKCADNFAPDHGEEKVFLDYADFRE